MNPTEGKLTEARIEALRQQTKTAAKYSFSERILEKFGEDIDTLCDMALESLKAPSVTTGERVNACGNSFGHKVALEQFTKDTVRFSCSCGKNGSTATTEAKAAELWNGINRNSPPAPLSSEAVGKVIKDAFKEGKIRGFRYGCEMSETWPENLQDQKAVTGVMLDQTDGYFIQALALLTPSPSEKERP